MLKTSAALISEKNKEIKNMEVTYQSLSEDYQRLDLTLDQRAERLEQRQRYLEQLLESAPLLQIDEKEVTSALEPAETDHKPRQFAEQSKMNMSAVFDNMNPAVDNVQQSVWPADIIAQHMAARLNKIDQSQRKTAEHIISLAKSDSQTIKNTLSQINLPFERVMTLAQSEESKPLKGIGGPFIESIDLGDLVDTDHPIMKAWEAHEHLALMKNIINAVPSLVPPEEYYISSPYGNRIDPYRKRRAFHPGIDMAGWPGTKIMASAPGKVVFAKFNGAYGRMVEIDHGFGIRTRYGHMRRLSVKKGERVERGQVIGEMGSTGRSTSTHLHYEIWFDGNTVNPYPFLKAADHVFQIQRRQGD